MKILTPMIEVKFNQLMRYYMFTNILNNINKKKLVWLSGLFLIFIFSIAFVNNNEKYYKTPIAKILSINESYTDKAIDNGKTEQMKIQKIKAIIMNGEFKGKIIDLNNETSFSNANDLDLKENDEVFIKINNDVNNLSFNITDFKRDKYMVYILSIFVMLAIIIGGTKGFLSLVSVFINIIITFTLIVQFAESSYLIPISFGASILFIVSSILIVCGKSNKSFSAIIGTLSGTFVSILISGTVIYLNNWNGIHFEEMDYLTIPPESIFFVELIVGTLGGIMDIAISIASAVTELYSKNPDIDNKTLIKSVKEIGQDIMGTMSNTLVFAYIGGSIPTILLYLRNNIPLTYILHLNLSLEYMRAIVGSIGIVISIPITMFTSIIIYKYNKIRKA
ncbi:hypothetical protein ClosIBUN13A_CONTIG119g01781 [Clostridium sp. IBUN13A]|nr:hypothetical protein ClosIBUN125C_CONTIG67g03715 [Clostridium sp. IBUN125C]KJZ97440.1 hypothetical protein ClosIBUN13A_CONTIG119g01781 [Clostridium sp. IBUN13A]